MKVLVDTNVVLDVLVAREPWFTDSRLVWQACEDGRITGCLLASTLTDIFYIARRIVGRDAARQSVELCLATFNICSINRGLIEQALLLEGNDFEDNVQIAAGVHEGVDAIVTRNPDDFAHATILVLTPSALLAQLP